VIITTSKINFILKLK